MRRVPACVVVLLGVGSLLAPGQALATTGARHTPGARPMSHVGLPVAPLSGATYSIGGTVLDYSRDPVAGADVSWGWFDSGKGYQFGGNFPSTAANGQFSLTGASSHPGRDDLWTWYDGFECLESWQNDFSTQNDATSYSYIVRPAAVGIDIAHAPAALHPLVDVFGAGSVAQSFAHLTSGKGVAWAPPPSFNDVVVYDFKMSGDRHATTAGAEWLGSSDVSVVAGTTAADPITFDWSHAQRAYLAGPLCRHSGKPGAVVRMVLKEWPAGQKAAFLLGGYSPYATRVSSAGAAKTYVVKLQIPKSAHPGQVYALNTFRADNSASNLNLVDYFQVCTFKASAGAIHRGTAIHLSGKVPSSAGYVYLFARHRTAGQPATVAAKGWVKVGRYRLKSGMFRSSLLHPERSTWYVARYSGGHGANFEAFTSVVKVSVR